MKRILAGLFVLMLSLPAMSGGYGPSAMRKQVEASMLLTGMIVIDPQGNVREHAIDQPEKVEKSVLDFVDTSVRQWKFEPIRVDGKPVSVRNRMSVRLVAKDLGNGNYNVRVSSVDFQPLKTEEDTEVTSRENSMMPPKYPMYAMRAGVQGTVYLAVRIGKDGKVMEVAPEQVNLKIVASAGDMRHWRSVLADSAAKAAKSWTFTPPSKGEQAGLPSWTVRVPVDYRFYDERGNGYGEWDAYVPGPRENIPWQDWTDQPGYSPDAVAANGGLYPVGGKGGLRLLTPLSGS